MLMLLILTFFRSISFVVIIYISVHLCVTCILNWCHISYKELLMTLSIKDHMNLFTKCPVSLLFWHSNTSHSSLSIWHATFFFRMISTHLNCYFILKIQVLKILLIFGNFWFYVNMSHEDPKFECLCFSLALAIFNCWFY